MRRLLRYVQRYWLRYAAGGACLLATATLAMAVPYLVKRAVDTIQAGGEARSVAWFAIVIVAIALLQGVVRTLSRALIFNVGRDVEYDLRNDLFAHLSSLPLDYYQRGQTGDLMSRLINDVTAVRMLLGVGALNLVNTPIYYIYGVSIMLSLSVPLTLAALLPYPILMFAVKRVSRRLMEQTLRVQEGLADLSSAVQENVSGSHVIRAYAAESVAVAQFERLNDQFTERSMNLARVRGRLMPLMRLASGTGTLVVLSYGGWQVIHGRLGLGDLVAFIGYLNLLAWPTMALGWMLSIVQRGRAAMQRLEQILLTVPDIADAPGTRPLGPVAGRIELRDVSFAYPGQRNGRSVLDHVSLTIAAGEKVAIVGRTGSGKTTLVQLLTRLFDPTSGAVLLDGRDLRDIPLADVRRAIGVVPQDPFLFSMSIKDNVAFGTDTMPDDAIHAAAAAAGVADDVAAFPYGFDTVIGERGVTLSGGQKQRLTLARALAVLPPVLILDDALSSVDTRTERHILHQLEAGRGDRTCIVIAHRISTIADSDRIVVMDEGRVAEIGDHQTLLARDGLYADMVRQQQLEDEIEELDTADPAAAREAHQ